ncbi:hypothetical protein EV193_105140 [Herbihabitans rhizosphaerae]|uniref:Uncharacterized protein n=1 Tax=Herbihabitans rhizosphaerae TaxID=1872711 RepID=A0A4Q7KQJ0_9PSEU|nr:DUF6346 domain-containing protein [Herbihabitans rhizosphaerae]RZS37582.1 hypothetical protein EV193_105140 [Herbihabitans rhizosphaerae]
MTDPAARKRAVRWQSRRRRWGARWRRWFPEPKTDEPASRWAAVGQSVGTLAIAVGLAGGVFLGASTVRTASGYQPGDPAGTVPAKVLGCAESDPISWYGFGRWAECEVEIIWKDRPTTIVLEAPGLHVEDEGRTVELERFAQHDSESGRTGYDYSPVGTMHSDWLYFGVAIPLTVLAALLGLLVCAAAAATVDAVRTALRRDREDQ